MKSFEALKTLVASKLTSSAVIERELVALSEAPNFIVDSFLKAYQHVVIEGNKSLPINECHSLIAYELGITSLHPGKISFHYPVEPGSFPDYDVDFANPDSVKEYAKNKYGEEHVIGIPTYGRYRTKLLLKDLCRVVLDENKKRIVSLEDINELNKKLPLKIDQEVSADMVDDEQDKESLDYELFTNSDIQTFQRKYPQIFNHFQKLYSTIKFRGVHAAGTVILPTAARDTLPLANLRGNVTAEWTEGQGVSELSSIGVIKIDILGLKTLKILDTCNRFILSRHHVNENTVSHCACVDNCESNKLIPMILRESTSEKLIDFNKLCLNYPEVYKNIGSNQNQGVFQFEPDGISAFAKHYGPTKFFDLALITALYRPGALDAKLDDLGIPLDPEDPKFKRAKSAAMVFVDRHHGKAEVYYPSQKVVPVLQESYGIAIFQEHLSQMIMAMTGGTFVEAEKIRKWLTKVNPQALKSDPDKIAELKAFEVKFTTQALANGCNEKETRAVWNLLVPFARYGFNLSHAISYSLISFQTAWCRTFYPLEYLTSLMIHNIDNTDKLIEYIRTAQKLKFKIVPPDINTSQNNFSINENNEIVCGLEIVKGVGEKATQQIIENKEKFGKFASLDDFLGRDIRWAKVNVGVLEALAKAGAFDSFSANRALTVAKIMIAKGKRKRSEFETIDMFSDETPQSQEIYVEEYTEAEKLNYEREYFGFTLEDFLIKNKKNVQQILNIIKSNLSVQKQVTIGTIDDIKLLQQKNNQQYARTNVTNFEGVKENWLFFASTWNSCKNTVQNHETYVCIGKKKTDDPTFIVDTIRPLNEFF